MTNELVGQLFEARNCLYRTVQHCFAAWSSDCSLEGAVETSRCDDDDDDGITYSLDIEPQSVRE